MSTKSGSPDIKTQLADEAVTIVTGARRSAYGTPEQNFERICRLWNDHMINMGVVNDPVLSAEDVAIFMILMKIARLAESPEHKDSVVDMLGYTLCYGELMVERPVEPAEDVWIKWPEATEEEERAVLRRAQNLQDLSGPWPDLSKPVNLKHHDGR